MCMSACVGMKVHTMNGCACSACACVSACARGKKSLCTRNKINKKKKMKDPKEAASYRSIRLTSCVVYNVLKLTEIPKIARVLTV